MPNPTQYGSVQTLPPASSLSCGPYRFALFKRGSRSHEKVSYPQRCGVYHEIDGPRAMLHFDLNFQIIRMVGKQDWPHPQEWLKRTIGGDWIYYSTGGYTGVFETTGEFYLPNLPYTTNNHLGGKPLELKPIRALIEGWPAEVEAIAASCRGRHDDVDMLIEGIRAQGPGRLAEKAANLHRIVGGPISVLPPDTRHVDYQVIPLNVSLGCLYKCGFCQVKNSLRFSELSVTEINAQLDNLRSLMADDLINFNSIFLGQHDGLNCHPSLLCDAIAAAQRKLQLDTSYLSGSNIFLFGSVGSLLKADARLFDDLDRLPGQVYINIGLESADQTTLDHLEKPLRAADVSAAFSRIQSINGRHRNVEITANFITDPELPESHYRTMLELIRDRVDGVRDKGCIYLSPLRFDDPSRARLFDFYKLKRLSRLPLFMYTIQRL